jgi:hypothetical protein
MQIATRRTMYKFTLLWECRELSGGVMQSTFQSLQNRLHNLLIAHNALVLVSASARFLCACTSARVNERTFKQGFFV